MKYSKKLLAVSNPSVVQKKVKQIFGSNVKLQPSKTKTKKYALITPTGKTVNFGSIDYQDYTKHKDGKRRDNYLKRSAGIKGNWRLNKYSANNLSMRLLWDGK
jgi:hypothetical protein